MIFLEALFGLFYLTLKKNKRDVLTKRCELCMLGCRPESTIGKAFVIKTKDSRLDLRREHFVTQLEKLLPRCNTD